MNQFAVCSNTDTRWQPTELARTLLSRHCRQVVGTWISHTLFLDAENEPCILDMEGEGVGTFDQLVLQTNPNLSPTVVRNELLRKGVVELDDSGYIILRRSAYVPGQTVVDRGALASRMAAVAGNHPRRRHNDLAVGF